MLLHIYFELKLFWKSFSEDEAFHAARSVFGKSPCIHKHAPPTNWYKKQMQNHNLNWEWQQFIFNKIRNAYLSDLTRQKSFRSQLFRTHAKMASKGVAAAIMVFTTTNDNLLCWDAIEYKKENWRNFTDYFNCLPAKFIFILTVVLIY